MARYMVVAHQTATSPELIERLRDIADRDGEARFTLVVPETPVSHMLLEHVTESREAARTAASGGDRAMRAAGLRFDRVEIGDASPMAAIEDEMRMHPHYDAVIISTLRPGVSKWLDLDLHHRVERKLSLPVIHVCEGGDAAWAGRHMTATEVPIPPPPPPAMVPAATGMRPRRMSKWPVLVALMFAYLLLTGGLALGVNSTFFIVDAIAIVVFAVLLASVWIVERTPHTA